MRLAPPAGQRRPGPVLQPRCMILHVCTGFARHRAAGTASSEAWGLHPRRSPPCAPRTWRSARCSSTSPPTRACSCTRGGAAAWCAHRRGAGPTPGRARGAAMFVRPASLGARVSRGSVPHTNRLRRFYAEWQAMKRFRSLPLEEREIVFYAETKADWVHFAPIIRELTEAHDKRVCYLTSDHEDSVLEGHHPNILPFGIGSGAVCTILFRALEARVMVITLTDLDAYHLKRSAAYPVHYVYVFHSMVSSHMVFRKKAYDAYDTILCVGPHHVREIRKNEALHGLKQKRLIEHGYGRLDTIIEGFRARPSGRPSPGPAKRVLIAPSWGPDCITAVCADALIAVLLSAGHHVTFRPHPMSARHQKAAIDRLRSTFGPNPRFALELDVRSSQSLEEADLMI